MLYVVDSFSVEVENDLYDGRVRLPYIEEWQYVPPETWSEDGDTFVTASGEKASLVFHALQQGVKEGVMKEQRRLKKLLGLL